jgi:hypothetical protein
MRFECMGESVSETFSRFEVLDEDGHRWAVVLEACDLASSQDPLLLHTVDAIRAAYGEQELRAMAEDAALLDVPTPAPLAQASFKLDNLIKALRASLPDPAKEGSKPPQLTNYRAETAEIVAREALARVFDIATPPALHATKGNRNQPILGFDGWSVMRLSGGQLALVLLQVKGTDDTTRPPGEAAKLIGECTQVVTDVVKLKGYLMACVVRCKGTEFAVPLMNMVDELERNGLIAETVVAPVIIRGVVSAHAEDLSSLRAATAHFGHARAHGMTLSIGANLNEFGRCAMNRARQHD